MNFSPDLAKAVTLAAQQNLKQIMACFDDIPEDRKESYPCPNPNCNGSVTQSEHGVWYCDSCAWNSDMPVMDYADD